MEIDLMNKEELRDYAKQTFGVDLDMRKGVEKLQDEVKVMKPVVIKITKPKKVPTFLKNVSTGHWFPYTDLLAARGDLVPCDENGDVNR